MFPTPVGMNRGLCRFRLGLDHVPYIRFSTLDFEGILTVENTNEFTRMLFAGIGPAKAFGCGLMLVRRI